MDLGIYWVRKISTSGFAMALSSERRIIDDMSSGPLLRVPRAALALAGLLYLTACEAWYLSINSDGLVFISVIGGTGEPRHRFRLRTRAADGAVRILDVPASGQLALRPAAADGTLELTLLHPEGCRVAGANPRTLFVAAGEQVEVDFDVRCGP